MILTVFLLMLAALCCSHFFSASETAYFSLGREDVESLRGREDRRSRMALALLEDPADLLITVLLGNMVVNVFYASLSVVLAHKLAGGNVSRTFGIELAALVVLIVMGEVVPKYVALSNPSGMSLAFSFPLSVFKRVAAPGVKVSRGIAHGVVNALVKQRKKPWVTSDEFDVILKMGEDHGVIDAAEEDLLQGVMDMREVKIREIMTPRVDMAAADVRISRNELEIFARENRRSKLPVFDGDVDNIIGVIHVKSLIFSASSDIKSMVRPVEFVPETMRALDLLESLKKEKENFAVVVDEHGGTAGVVTLEDVMEEVVGEIEDKYDQENPPILEVEPGQYMVRGGISIREWNEYFDTEIEDDDVDTIGGYVMSVLDRAPVVGDTVNCGRMTLRISKVVRRRLTEIEVIRQ